MLYDGQLIMWSKPFRFILRLNATLLCTYAQETFEIIESSLHVASHYRLAALLWYSLVVAAWLGVKHPSPNPPHLIESWSEHN